MKAIGASSLAFVLLAALLPGRAHAKDPERDKKGKDPSLYAREDSLRRAQAEAQRRKQLEARADFARALQLDGNEEDCVAFDPGRSACLVTVAEFNRSAAEWPPSQGRSLRGHAPEPKVEELRRKVLHSLLATDYLEHRLSRDPGKDSLNAAWQAWRSRRLESTRKQVGDSALRALYHARYERDYRRRDEPVVQVLGMGDSALADSLWRSFSDSSRTDSSRSPGNPGPRRDAWRWRSPPAEDLPSGAAAAAAALRRGEVSRPWKTPYGYLLLRWVSVRHRPEIPFEDAVPDLLALAMDPEMGNGKTPKGAGTPASGSAPGGIPESLVTKYYASHREAFRSPDTARFQAQLLPDAVQRRTRASRAEGTAPVETTASAAEAPKGDGVFRPAATVGFFDLPPSVQRQLERFLPAESGAILGTFPSVFGTWRFKVLATAPGGRLLSLREARPAILSALGNGATGPAYAQHQRSLDRQGWGLMAARHLEARFAAEASTDASAAGPSVDPSRRMAADKAEWMRRYLDIRFIGLDGG
jgi:hypothetical protein